MPALILEGGTFRPIFSAGVMDALLDANVMFDYVIGVSAGITNGVSYLSRQKGRNLSVLTLYRNDRRYIGVRNFFKCKSLFGLDFIYQEVPKTYEPFDWETFCAYNGTALVGVTNARTGRSEYKDALELDERCTLLRATCAIPFFFPAIEIDGVPYYDGGICDPIPICKALSDGQTKQLIVLTRPQGYQKGLSRADRVAAGALRHRYPAISRALLTRHTHYNDTVALCESLARGKDTVLLRPAYPLKSFEKDVDVLAQSYRHGYEMAMAHMDVIRALTDAGTGENGRR